MTKLVTATVCAVLATGCGSKGGGIVDKTSGTVTMGDRSLTITSCKALVGEHGKATVALTLDNGLTLTSDPMEGLIASTDQARLTLQCDSLGGSMTSGVSGKAAWAEGDLQASCKWSAGDLVVAVTYDCGTTSRPSNRSARPKPPPSTP